MEDVLEVSAEPYDPRRPKVNVDATNTQVIKETRLPLPAQPGQPQRFDDEYERHGTRHLLLVVEPPAGRRHGQVTAQRTKVDFAHAMQWLQWLVDIGYPDAEASRVVLDNRNTHTIASLSEAFAPAEARRIARKLELHDTPKHGSWLNMAAIAWHVLQQQCLDRRIPDEDMRTREIVAWEHQRNVEQATIDWRFSVTDARQKLKRLYPSLPA
jgi:hypothetical protein